MAYTTKVTEKKGQIKIDLVCSDGEGGYRSLFHSSFLASIGDNELTNALFITGVAAATLNEIRGIVDGSIHSPNSLIECKHGRFRDIDRVRRKIKENNLSQENNDD